MNLKDRNRYDRAYKEGKQAFLDGKSLDDCPYKRSNWGAGDFWAIGWGHAKAERSKKISEEDDTR